MRFCYRFVASLLALGLGVGGALAQDGVRLDTEVASDRPPPANGDPDSLGPPWGAAAMSVELGLFYGAFIPSSKHELYNASDLDISYQKLERVTPELGLRVGFFPVRVLGFEAEAAFMPTQTRRTSQSVNVWAVRGHLILQPQTKPIVPFLLIGGGVIGISSRRSILGSDQDGELHAGVGVKGYVTSGLALRLEVRDNFTQGFGANETAQHWEALLGMSIVLGRPEPPPPPPPDRDRDGVPDTQDQCPDTAGDPPKGCPPPPPDTDGDGILNAQDACPAVAGVPSADLALNGCPPPPPPPDGDADGVPDASDRCPTVAGDGPDGCLLDVDNDGIPNRDDKCIDQPETRNGYEDSDGCPDELPQIVQRFTGTIAGIAFDTGKATIRATSFPVLDQASKVLVDYPTLRVEISGHTDNTGTLEKNVQLSKERADAVKAYIVSKGVAPERIETRGAGPTEPVAPNLTPDGRSKNRRVEFKLLMEAPKP